MPNVVPDSHLRVEAFPDYVDGQEIFAVLVRYRKEELPKGVEIVAGNLISSKVVDKLLVSQLLYMACEAVLHASRELNSKLLALILHLRLALLYNVDPVRRPLSAPSIFFV